LALQSKGRKIPTGWLRLTEPFPIIGGNLALRLLGLASALFS
jgi:hypothetical protein